MPDEFSQDEIRILAEALDPNALAQALVLTPEQLEQIDLGAIAIEYGGLADPIGQLQTWLANQFSGMASWIVSSVSAALSQALGPISSVLEAISSIINEIPNFFSNVINTIQNLASSLGQQLANLQSAIASSLQSVAQEIISSFQKFVVEPVTDLINNVVKALSVDLPNAIRNVFGTLERYLKVDLPRAVEGAVKGVVEAARGTLQPLLDTARQIGEVIGDAATRLSTFFTRDLPALFEKAAGQLRSAVEGVFNAIQAWGRRLEDAFRDITEAVAKAVEQIRVQIPSAVQELWASISQAFENLRRFLTVELPKMLENLPAALEKGVENVTEWIWERLPDWARKFLEEAPKALTQLGTALTGFVNAILKFPEWFPKWFEENIAKPISEAIANIWKPVEGFFNWLTTEFQKALNEFIRWATQDVPAFFAWIRDEAWKAITGLADWASKGFQWLTTEFSKAWESFVGWLNWVKEQAWAFISGGIEWLTKGFQWLATEFSKAWESFVKFFTETVPGWFAWLKEEAWRTVSDAVRAMNERGKFWTEKWEQHMGPLVNTLDEISRWAWDWLKAFEDPLEALKSLGQSLWQFATETLLPAIVGALKTIWNAIKSAADTLMGILSSFASTAIQGASGVAKGLVTSVMGALGDFARGVLGVVNSAFFSPLAEAYSKVWEDIAASFTKPSTVPGAGEVEYILATFAHVFASLLSFNLSAGFIAALAKAFGKINKTIGIPGTNITWEFNVGYFLGGMAKAIGRAQRELIAGILYGYAIWLTSIMFKPINALFRDVYPIEMPATPVLIEMVRRTMPLKYEQVPGGQATYWDVVRDQLYKYIMMYGYSTPVARLMYAKPEETLITFPNYAVKPPSEALKETKTVSAAIAFKDRFGAERKLPLALIYDLPSSSEMCRMMVHDLFLTFDDFKRSIAARGIYEDIAWMYYLLHFRYPSPEKLWEFVSRAHARMLWYSPPDEVVQDVAAEIQSLPLPDNVRASLMPVPPIGLNVRTTEDSDRLFAALTRYMKWHDYARFSWIPGFTCDNWLIIDLMADIPTRIDARWMYKWRAFTFALKQRPNFAVREEQIRARDELELSRIVIARGMHPAFVHAVAIAEAMNALAEERTLFRSGLLAAFREGFLSAKDLDAVMAGMFTLDFYVFTWNPGTRTFRPAKFTVPVSFLEGERKLLELRALYDRALDVLRDAARELRRLAYENIITIDDYKEDFKGIVAFVAEKLKEVARALGIEKGFRLSLDPLYEEIYPKVIELFSKRYVVSRLRYWIRYSLWNLLRRFERGYVSDEELEKIIGELADSAKLTDEEKELLKEIGKTLRDVYRREILARAILRKYAKGELTREDAVRKLVELGVDEETANAMIEAEVRVYIPTVSQVATLAEVVPEATKLLHEVFERRGVPPHHRPIWEKYVRIRPIYDEVRRLVTELITDYARGVITKAQLERELRELEPLGVSKEERVLLLKLAELRRRRYERTRR